MADLHYVHFVCQMEFKISQYIFSAHIGAVIPKLFEHRK